jgi:hypothetical protein
MAQQDSPYFQPRERTLVTPSLPRFALTGWIEHAMILTMLHRHLSHHRLTLAAIDDVIARGKRKDWVELRRAALDDQDVMQKVLRVCLAQIADPSAQRYHFWKQYAERHLA